jgi:DNA-binding transcriptional regulator YhcF (GntR family)
MRPFNLPSINELALSTYNHLIAYQKEYEELELKIPTLQGFERTLTIIRSNTLKIEIYECKKILERYIPEIRDEKLKQLGI